MKSTLCFVAVLLFGPLLATAQAGPPRPSSHENPRTLQTIQYECLRAWAPDLIYDASGAENISAKALHHGEVQQELLTETVQTAQGRFYPSNLEDLRDALEYYVTDGTRFLDLGSGDGRVVFLANVLGAHATGIESDLRLFETSQRAQAALSQQLAADRLRLVEGDFFAASWADYDVIFYYDLGTDDPLRLRQKIFAELGPQAVLLVAHPEIPFPGLVAETSFEAVTAYRQPQTLVEPNPGFLATCEKEVVRLHRFLEEWFNGQVENSEEQLSRFSDALHPGFETISPKGKASNPALATSELRGAYGLWRSQDAGPGKLRIENFELRYRTGHAAVVSYDEMHQSHGRRRSFKVTAVLQLRWGQAEGIEWMHLHRSPSSP
jgi:hypothetical protein